MEKPDSAQGVATCGDPVITQGKIRPKHLLSSWPYRCEGGSAQEDKQTERLSLCWWQ